MKCPRCKTEGKLGDIVPTYGSEEVFEWSCPKCGAYGTIDYDEGFILDITIRGIMGEKQD